MRPLLELVLGLAAVAAVTAVPERIVGGNSTTIERYPFGVVILNAISNFGFSCGGSIINARCILSAAHCFQTNPVNQFRIRVGSTYSNEGGIVHHLIRILNHPNYIRVTLHYDFSLLRTATRIVQSSSVGFGRVAGPHYHVGDNVSVYAIGWGALNWNGRFPTELQHVQLYTINLDICRQRYVHRRPVTHAMICSGILDVGGRDQCQGDSGGPLLHGGNVIIGVCSFGHECAHPNYPGVNAKVSIVSRWIELNCN